MIEVSRVTVSAGKRKLLREVSFKVNNGRVYGVFGLVAEECRALTALLAGALEPAEGEVRINGFHLLSEGAAARRCVGYFPAEADFYPAMTVYELLDFVAGVKAVRDDRRFLHVHELMEQFDLEELRDRRVGALRTDERARLGVALACVGDPDILILEDPCYGLSGKARAELSELLESLAEKGKTVFWQSSSAAELDPIVQEVFLVENGTVGAPVPREELLGGVYLELTVQGDRRAVTAALSEVGGLLSCTVKGTDAEGGVTYRLKAVEDRSQEVREALRAAGFENVLVVNAPASETEAAYRAGALRAIPREEKGGEEE